MASCPKQSETLSETLDCEVEGSQPANRLYLQPCWCGKKESLENIRETAKMFRRYGHPSRTCNVFKIYPDARVKPGDDETRQDKQRHIFRGGLQR